MYLVRKKKAKTAHIWTGYDTACRMYSTNGLRKIAYMVVAESDLPTCSMCDAVNVKRQTLWPKLPVKPAQVEPWRPVMTEQERQEHEKYVEEHKLPF